MTTALVKWSPGFHQWHPWRYITGCDYYGEVLAAVVYDRYAGEIVATYNRKVSEADRLQEMIRIMHEIQYYYGQVIVFTEKLDQ